MKDNNMDVLRAIAERQTAKMLASPDAPLPPKRGALECLMHLLDAAGKAPFHRPAHTSHRIGTAAELVEPWRFYIFEAEACRALLALLQDWPEKTGKILNMLAAADALALATWLPNPSPSREASGLFDPTEDNMEHIAAAGAAAQNFLLAATAFGLKSYWSSGGVLRSAALFERFGIPSNQILVGAVFLFPSEPEGPVETLPGKMRKERSAKRQWARWIEAKSIS